MKYTHLLRLLLLVPLLALTACTEEDADTPGLSQNPYIQEHQDPATRGELVSIEEMGIVDKAILELGVSELVEDGETPPLVPTYNVAYYKVSYRTLDWNNQPVMASGALALPVTTDPVRIAGYGHGTSTTNGVPSQVTDLLSESEHLIGILLASTGYAVALPDYLGLGAYGPEDGIPIHPYVHRKTEAMSTIDLMRIARQQLQQRGTPERAGGVFLTGYSQGGHTTMATHWDIEAHHQGEFEVFASAPLSGPYSLSGVFVELLSAAQPYSQPVFLPYVLFSMNQAYELFASQEDYLKPEYVDVLYDLFLERAKHTRINDAMPANRVPIEIIREDARAAFEEDASYPFRLALQANDVMDFGPQAPVLACYCTQDEQVPIENAFRAKQAWEANGAVSVQLRLASDSLLHTPCAVPSFITAYQWLDSLEQL